MHGIIHAELKKFVEKTYGADAWTRVLVDAGVPQKMYLANTTYPDEETARLIAAAAKVTGADPQRVMEAFGEFIVPDLVSMFAALIKPEWKTMELLLNTEETIHRVVRNRNPGAAPPRLRFSQTGPRTLLLKYDSPRRMAAVARGIVKGVAKQYGEKVAIQERPTATGCEMTIVVA